MARISVDDLKRHYSVDDHQLQLQCLDQHLEKLAHKVPNWLSMAMALGLEDHQQQAIKVDLNLDYLHKNLETLKVWKKNTGRNATYLRLVKACLEISNAVLAGEVCELAKTATADSNPHSLRKWFTDIGLTHRDIETLEEHGFSARQAFTHLKRPDLNYLGLTRGGMRILEVHIHELSTSESQVSSQTSDANLTEPPSVEPPGAKRPEYKALIACKDQIVLELTQFVNSEDLEKTFFAEGLFSSSVHSTLQSHNTMGIKSELLVNALTRRVKIFPHFFYGMVHILKSQEALSSTLFENLRRQYEELLRVEILYWTSVKVTDESQSLKLENYGLKLFIPDCSLPIGLKTCTLTIGVIGSGQFDIPRGHSVSSAIYGFQVFSLSNEKVKFTKPFQVTMQHCANLEAVTTGLKIVRASCNNMTPPYVFKETPTDTTANLHYVSLELNQFSYWTSTSPCSKFYSAILYIHRKKNEIIIAIIPKLDSFGTKVNEEYSKQGYTKVTSLDCFEFEDEYIDLGIDFKKGVMLTDGWKLMPFKSTRIEQKQVDLCKENQEKPYFHLKISKPLHLSESTPYRLDYTFKLSGISEGKYSGNKLAIIDEHLEVSSSGADDVSRKFISLTTDDLKNKFELQELQLSKEIQEEDLTSLAKCFRTSAGLFEKLHLCPADCATAESKCKILKIQTGIEYALKEWRRPNPAAATFIALLEILLSLDRCDTANHICEYIKREIIIEKKETPS